MDWYSVMGTDLSFNQIYLYFWNHFLCNFSTKKIILDVFPMIIFMTGGISESDSYQRHKLHVFNSYVSALIKGYKSTASGILQTINVFLCLKKRSIIFKIQHSQCPWTLYSKVAIPIRLQFRATPINSMSYCIKWSS